MENEELENQQPAEGVKDAEEALEELKEELSTTEGIKMPESSEEMEQY